MINLNPILAIDAYKFGHMSMHPEVIDYVYGNLTPRSTKYFDRLVPEGFKDGKLVNFGMQMAIQDINEAFTFNFFNRDIEEIIPEFMETAAPFIGENREARDILEANVRALHKLGYLPLRIKTLPEGTITKAQVPSLTIINTKPGFGWLPNYLETFLSQSTWKTVTVATMAKLYNKIFKHYSELTCDNDLHIPFQGHDFSARGMSSTEDSIKSGIAALTQSWGSDSVHAAYSAKEHYNFTNDIPLAFSVPATEHSIMCLGSALTSEEDTFRRLLTQYNTGIISIVSDTYDYWHTITKIASNLKDDILARQPDSNGLCKTVFRPDSGNPVDIICGTGANAIIIDPNCYKEGSIESWKEAVAEDISEKFNAKLVSTDPIFAIEVNYSFEGNTHKVNYEPDLSRHDKTYYYVDNYGSNLSKCKFTKLESTPQQKGSIEILWDTFGGTINNKGYKVLNSKVGLIYGESITPQRAVDIFTRLEAKGFASSNIVFGIGSYAFNYSTRDTLGYAFKATCAIDNTGKVIPIQKIVATDTTKKSAAGLLHVSDDLIVTNNVTLEMEATGALKVIFEDGNCYFEHDFAKIRERASK